MDDKKIISEIELLGRNILKNNIAISNEIYSQIESLIWLQKRLKITGELPPLRGWPTSPDFLLRLHKWITRYKPLTVVETGSGASTVVIADALRQNGFGKLYSFEHMQKYAAQTNEILQDEFLTPWVELLVGELELWRGEHLNPIDSDKPSSWYPLSLIGFEKIDLLVVDGPPKSTCQYARYPALPALFDRLSPHAEIWMDDATRQEEKDICKKWAEQYSFNFEYIPLEKGLCVLSRL